MESIDQFRMMVIFSHTKRSNLFYVKIRTEKVLRNHFAIYILMQDVPLLSKAALLIDATSHHFPRDDDDPICLSLIWVDLYDV